MSGIRILHVDDDPQFAELASIFLEREDDRFSVDTAASVSEGLAHLADHDVDCVVSDYDMPGENGIEFLQTVRESSDLPFILFTGKGSEEVASEAISAGVTDYLQKESHTSQYAVLANRITNAVEQSRARRAVEEAERTLSQLADKSKDVLFLFDGDWRELLFVNEAYEEIWGRSIETLADDPQSFLDGVHPEDRERVQRSMERISNGEEMELEYRVDRPDGDRRWVRAETRPVFDDGAVTRIVGFVRDITANRKQERAVEDARERFRTLIEHGSDMITVIDESGEVQYQSPAIERVLGYEPAERIGENAFDSIHPDDRDRVWEAFARTIERPETTTERVEYRFEHADGSWVWLETIGSNQTNTAVDGYVLTSRDITDRRARERELERTNALLSTLFEALPVGVLAEDESRDVLAINEQLFELFELPGTPSAAVGADCEAMARTVSDTFVDPAAFVERTAELVDARERTANEELALRDGRTFSRTYRPIELPDGDGHLWVYRDTTERDERERELTRQNDRLDEFASVVSHDLRNPLNIATGRLELAREECESPHLDDVRWAHDRMNDLVDDLLTLAREGERVGETEPVELASLGRHCWRHVATADATLVVETDRTIEADRSRLEQLLENLVRNAVEHGGESVTVTIGDVEGGFYLEDDGPGIPPAEREAVFDSGYSTSATGTGFGLSIVAQVVDAHGWELSVTDGTDGGARFEITGLEFTDEEE